MTLSDDLVLSQSSLQDYADCARRFELKYIDRVRYPSLEAQPVLEFEAKMRLGARFHTMVQQCLVGVPAELLAKSVINNETLHHWWEIFTQKALHQLPEKRVVETTLQTTVADQSIIAKYDLITIEPEGQVTIIDWKTSATVTRRSILQKRLQTIMYPYVLAQAGSHLYGGEPIPPDKIKMIYWFVANQGEEIVFDYSVEQMQADEASLHHLIQDIQSANLFPLTSDTRHCRFCTYRTLCNRGNQAGNLDEMDMVDEEIGLDDFDIDVDQIAEIEF